MHSEHQQQISNLQYHLEKIEKFDNLDWILDNNYIEFFVRVWIMHKNCVDVAPKKCWQPVPTQVKQDFLTSKIWCTFGQ